MTARRSTPYLKLDTSNPLPTVTDSMRGQIRLDPATGAGDEDTVMFVGKNEDGTISYRAMNGIAIQVADVTLEDRISVMDFGGDDFVVSESPDYEANVSLLGNITMTLGPYFLNDVPGTATSNLFSMFFDTTTAVSIGTTGSWYMPVAGRVVGGFIQSDTGRTAGTAQLRPTISGTGTSFTGGNPTLDATNTSRHSVLTTWANGVSFNAGQRVGCELITSGWTPTTANVTALLVVRLDS